MHILSATSAFKAVLLLSLTVVNADPLSRWQRLSMRISELEKKFTDDFTLLREELYNDFLTRQELMAKYNVSLTEKGCPSTEVLETRLSAEMKQNQVSIEQIEDAFKTLETDIMTSLEVLKRGLTQEKVFRRDVQRQVQGLKVKYDLEKDIFLDILRNISLEISSIYDLLSRSVEMIGSAETETRKVPELAEEKRDCLGWLNSGHMTSGVYSIRPIGLPHSVSVYCDMETEGGGWVVFQRRFDGSVDFYRNWMDYRFGFGNVSGEFWLGNELIHLLTSKTQWFTELRIDLEDFENETKYEVHRLFSLGSHEDNFRLHVSDSEGTAGDCLAHHNGAEFSTFDKGPTYGCALKYKGGFWYKACHIVNINGVYLHGQHESYADGVNWKCWKGYHYSLKRTEMKLRSKCRKAV